MNLSKYPFRGTKSDQDIFIRGIIAARDLGVQIQRRSKRSTHGKWVDVPLHANMDTTEFYYRVENKAPAPKPAPKPFDYNVFPPSSKYGSLSLLSAGLAVPEIPFGWTRVKSGKIKAGDICVNAYRFEWAYGLIGDDVAANLIDNKIYRRPAPVVDAAAAYRAEIEKAYIDGKSLEYSADSGKTWASLGAYSPDASLHWLSYIYRETPPAKPFDYNKFPKNDDDANYTEGLVGVPTIPLWWVQLDKSEVIKSGDIVQLSGGRLEWAYGYIGEQLPQFSSNVAYRRPAKLHNPDEVAAENVGSGYRLLTVDEIKLPQNESTEWYEARRGWRKPAYLETTHSPTNTYRTNLSVADYAKASAEAAKPKVQYILWTFESAPKGSVMIRFADCGKSISLVTGWGVLGLRTVEFSATWQLLGDSFEYSLDGKTWNKCVTAL